MHLAASSRHYKLDVVNHLELPNTLPSLLRNDYTILKVLQIDPKTSRATVITLKQICSVFIWYMHLQFFILEVRPCEPLRPGTFLHCKRKNPRKQSVSLLVAILSFSPFCKTSQNTKYLIHLLPNNPNQSTTRFATLESKMKTES